MAMDAAAKGSQQFNQQFNQLWAELVHDALLDEKMQARMEAIHRLEKCYSALRDTLKHEAERGQMTAKMTRETRDALSHLIEADPARASIALRSATSSGQALEAALEQSWEDYANAIEKQLREPAKQVIAAFFAEAEKLYANYVSVVNELSAKQAKEKRVHGAAARRKDTRGPLGPKRPPSSGRARCC